MASRLQDHQALWGPSSPPWEPGILCPAKHRLSAVCPRWPLPSDFPGVWTGIPPRPTLPIRTLEKWTGLEACSHSLVLLWVWAHLR